MPNKLQSTNNHTCFHAAISHNMAALNGLLLASPSHTMGPLNQAQHR